METLTVEISGNHEDPHGNPVAYERMTQKSKWKDPAALRYLAWKQFVQLSWIQQTRPHLPDKKNGHYRLDVVCYVQGERHADPENIRKGIQDALFQVSGDKHVTGLVELFHVARDPKVSITIFEDE
jgi:hypothetical protein